jgi:hypothetical protein
MALYTIYNHWKTLRGNEVFSHPSASYIDYNQWRTSRLLTRKGLDVLLRRRLIRSSKYPSVPSQSNQVIVFVDLSDMWLGNRL